MLELDALGSGVTPLLGIDLLPLPLPLPSLDPCAMETPAIGTTAAAASAKERPNQRERRDGGDRGEETGETRRPISWLFLPDGDDNKTGRGNGDEREETGERETS